MGGRSSPARWSADCIIATRDAQPDLKSRSHMKSGVSCAHCARLRRMLRSIRACRAIGNARKGPSSVRWVTFAIIAAHISQADNVLRNDTSLDDPLADELGHALPKGALLRALGSPLLERSEHGGPLPLRRRVTHSATPPTHSEA